MKQIMSAESGADEGIDWAKLSAAWETSLPSDYMAFMTDYGAGEISGAFSIVCPQKPGVTPSDVSGMAHETANARELWQPASAPSGAGTGKVPVIAWGVSAGADIVCWLTENSDPDQWPVAVLGRHTKALWKTYECGMVEFLCRLFHAEFDESPLSDDTLLGNASPQFLNYREIDRCWGAGVDPWTGEPDPFAGFEFDLRD
ncbi:SMI1/KNR4 family protein [Streptomyces noursei]|uniref:SMI1/KNR4 family protein n=1 Tax=Streptomyces noursei TaxID=1971 RepID=UPI0038212787